MSDLFEGSKRLFIDEAILFRYFGFPKGDKHVLGLYWKTVSGVGTVGYLLPSSRVQDLSTIEQTGLLEGAKD